MPRKPKAFKRDTIICKLWNDYHAAMLHDWLLALGATQQPKGSYDTYTIETRYGLLGITKFPNDAAIFTQFEDSAKARAVTSSCVGKWNFHGQDAEEVLNDFKYQLEGKLCLNT